MFLSPFPRRTRMEREIGVPIFFEFGGLIKCDSESNVFAYASILAPNSFLYISIPLQSGIVVGKYMSWLKRFGITNALN